MKGRDIGLKSCRISTKLCLCPGTDSEVAADRQELLCRLFRRIRLINLLIGDHQVGKAKPRVASIVGLEGGYGILNPSCQPISISKMSKIESGTVRAKG